MLFITLHHFSLWAQGGRSDYLIAHNHLWSAFWSLFYLPLGDIGVYVFVMITGFYLGTRDISINRSIKKTLKVYAEVYFYSILFLVLAINWQSPVKSNKIWQSLMPVTFNQYWFVSGYVILMLLIPFINRSIRSLTKKQFGYLLVIMSTICGIFPLVDNNIASESVGLGILLTAYLFGAFVSKFIHRNWWNFLVGFVLFTINTVVIYIIMYYQIQLTRDRFTNIYTGIFALLAAFGLFLIFINFKPGFHVLFNQVARHMFSVYLITQNVFVLKALWSNFYFRELNNLVQVNINGLGVVLLIMLACYLMDIVRALIFKLISLIKISTAK